VTPTKISFSPSPGKSQQMKKSKSLDLTEFSEPSTSKCRKKLTTLIEAVPIETQPEQFENYCQFCLKQGTSNILWIQCDGGCQRWHHQKCVKEFKDLTKAKVFTIIINNHIYRIYL
jgi:hypothetical protein